MTIMKKILSAVLLASMALSLAACGGDTPAADNTSLSTDTPAQTETQDTPDMLELPADLKFTGNTVTILTAESILGAPDELTEETDLIDQAKYDIDRAVEERLGVTVDYVGVVPWQDTSGMIRQSVNSGSDDYQMVFTCAQHQVNLVNEGLYLTLDELPYIDIEKPWWNKEYIRSVSLHEDDLYILFGDITYNTIQRTTCVFFNMNLLEERLNMKPEELYEIVHNGEWTIDKMSELVSQVYVDDGNAIRDGGDIYGLISPWNETFNWMAFGSGIKFTTRNEDGYPEINLNNETTVDLVEKLCKLFFNNDGATVVGNAADDFGAGKALFIINRFFLTSWEQFRTMEDDYGILPIPKYDETVDGYHSTVEELVQWGAVPVTTADPIMTSAVAEAMAYEGRQKLTPAYYDTTLKLKLTRDDASMEMIDLIMSGRDTDYLYINPLGGLENVFEKVYSAKQNTFASAYASVEMAGIQALTDLIEEYESHK